ncbi:hypothetical protein AAG570_010868, partial [Ranatra chinensis]
SSNFESGFEDDFSSFVASNATTPGTDIFSDSTPDPFSPVNKTCLPFELSNEDPKARRYASTSVISSVSKPTIIRVKSKPSRPPPPKKVDGWGENDSCPTYQVVTPVKPTVPPPPPPPDVVQELLNGPPIPPRPRPQDSQQEIKERAAPYCIAEYDYEATHVDDLSFKIGDAITLLSEVNSDWLKGRLGGKEGIFPRNYVKIVVPLNHEEHNLDMMVIALYSFTAETWDDLDFQEGEEIKVLRRINENWLYGECNGKRGQFPENYVQDISLLVSDVS